MVLVDPKMGPEKGYANKYSKTYLVKVTIARKVVRQQEIAPFHECVEENIESQCGKNEKKGRDDKYI